MARPSDAYQGWLVFPNGSMQRVSARLRNQAIGIFKRSKALIMLAAESEETVMYYKSDRGLLVVEADKQTLLPYG